MNILLAIGNPGRNYELTRHNVAYILLNEILKKYNVSLKAGKGDYFEADIEIEEERLKIVKSSLYMNRSGIVADQISALPIFSLDKFLVVLDDFEIPLGKIRMRKKGSSGGHRGLGSIIYTIGTDTFSRLRIGIGPVEKDPVDFVLSKFTSEEIEIINKSVKKAITSVGIFVKEGIEKAMNYANS